MTDTVTSLIRTWVPVAVGAAITWAAQHHEIVLDESTSTGLMAGATGVVIAVYYAIVRALESRFPAIGVLLGSTKAPSYVGGQINGNPADMAHEPIRVPAIVSVLLLIVGAPLIVWLIGEGQHELAALVGGFTGGGGVLAYTESVRARVDSPATEQARFDEAVADVEISTNLPVGLTEAGLPIRFETPTETAEYGIGD